MATFLTLGMPKPEGHRPLLAGLLVTSGGPGAVGRDGVGLHGVGLDGVGLDAAWTAERASDALAALVHAGPAFDARAEDAAGVLRVLAATVAALRGDDVRAAWAAPDASRVSAVPDPAAEALREVLRHVVVPDVDAATSGLAALGVS